MLLVLTTILGIFLPITALIVEAWTHICAHVFFDPIPSPLHILAISSVPISNTISLFFLFSNKKIWFKPCLIINSIAAAVSIIYTIIFLPTLPLGIVTLMFGGFGILCFSPLLSLICLLKTRKQIKRKAGLTASAGLPLDVCFALIILLAAVINLSSNLTSEAEQSAWQNKKQDTKSVLLLRAFGDKETMLRACYNLPNYDYVWLNIARNICLRVTGLYKFFHEFNEYLSSDLARELFYRATGKSFNSLARPKLKSQDKYRYLDDSDSYYYYDWNDQDFAGETVGGLVKDLKLKDSIIHATVNPDACVGHLTWALNFDKFSHGTKELRTQILLPPGAVVSGAWLKINDQNIPAIFAPKYKARTAYVKEAYNGHRSLLISSAGPGRVLIQSPTISENSELSLSIDFPLHLLSDKEVLIPLPSFAERNFEAPTKTSVEIINEQNTSSRNPNIISLELTNTELFTGSKILKLARNSNIKNIFVENDRNPNLITQEQISELKNNSNTPLILIIDGSANMSCVIGSITKVLQKAKCQNISLVWASDIPSLLAKNLSTNSQDWKNNIANLTDVACVGGQNNAEAISLALDTAAKQNIPYLANILWIHGPQPIKLNNLDLIQKFIFANRFSNFKFYEYQAVLGPNDLIKELEQTNIVNQLGHFGSIENDLDIIIEELNGNKSSFCVTRQILAKNSLQEFQKNTNSDYLNDSDSITKLAFYEKIMSQMNYFQSHFENQLLAKEYKLVTPISSAIVILNKYVPTLKYAVPKNTNNKNSYTDTTPKIQNSDTNNSENILRNNDLEIAEESSLNNSEAIPTAPEPATNLLLVCLGIIFSFMIYFKHRTKQKTKIQC